MSWVTERQKHTQSRRYTSPHALKRQKLKDRKQVLVYNSLRLTVIGPGLMGNLAVSWFPSLLFIFIFFALSLSLFYIRRQAFFFFSKHSVSQAFKMWPFFPCTFQHHYATLLLNKRLYYVPAPPVKGQKWTQFLSAERINQDYVSWKESQTAVARHCVSVCLSVCKCVYPLSARKRMGKLQWREALVGYEHARLGDKDVIWGLKSGFSFFFFCLFMYLPTPPQPTPFSSSVGGLEGH